LLARCSAVVAVHENPYGSRRSLLIKAKIGDDWDELCKSGMFIVVGEMTDDEVKRYLASKPTPVGPHDFKKGDYVMLADDVIYQGAHGWIRKIKRDKRGVTWVTIELENAGKPTQREVPLKKGTLLKIEEV
jgi:hypothetical protein